MDDGVSGGGRRVLAKVGVKFQAGERYFCHGDRIEEGCEGRVHPWQEFGGTVWLVLVTEAEQSGVSHIIAGMDAVVGSCKVRDLRSQKSALGSQTAEVKGE